MNYTMHYSRFKPKALIDFLEVTFETTQRTNLKTVQPKISYILRLAENKRASISLLDETGGGSASKFSFRIQNPKNHAHVERVFAELKRLFDLKTEPIFTACEPAFDLIRKPGTTHEELAEAVAHLYKFSAYHPPTDNHRIYFETAEEVPARLESLQRAIADGCCIGVGSQREHNSKRGKTLADPISARYYLKTKDDGNELPEDQHRARTERTLQGDAMPFKTLAGLASFDFTTLQPLFSFRKLKDDLHPTIAAPLNDYVFGNFDAHKRNRCTGGTRNNHPATKADSELNELVRRALRCLNKRWSKSIACENSVLFEDANPENMGANNIPANNYYFNPNNQDSKNKEEQDSEDKEDKEEEIETNNIPVYALHLFIASLSSIACVCNFSRTSSFHIHKKSNFHARLNNRKLIEIYAAQSP